jgi:hypothetical protein
MDKKPYKRIFDMDWAYGLDVFAMKLDNLLNWKSNLSDDMLNGCSDLSGSGFEDLGAPDWRFYFIHVPNSGVKLCSLKTP